jgi:CheY-like chemotaxis protein
MLVADVLREAGYSVDTARSAIGAGEYIRLHRYDLVLTDWRLGGGTASTGITIADAASRRGAKAIIVTGFAPSIPEDDRERHEVIEKPVRPSELVRAVERQIGPAE